MVVNAGPDTFHERSIGAKSSIPQFARIDSYEEQGQKLDTQVFYYSEVVNDRRRNAMQHEED